MQIAALQRRGSITEATQERRMQEQQVEVAQIQQQAVQHQLQTQQMQMYGAALSPLLHTPTSTPASHSIASKQASKPP
jgi:hypothetical protein